MNTTDPRWRRPRTDDGPVIDMTVTGEFVDARHPGGPPLSTKVIAVGVVIAAVAGALGIALLALWLALTLIPIAIAGGAIAYGMYRLQTWQARRHSLGGKRDVFRP